jgi:hypothetical protein
MYTRKIGLILKNNKLEKAYNIEVKQTNKGYNITGVNNGKIVKKFVRYITTKMNKKKTNKKKTNKKNKK